MRLQQQDTVFAPIAIVLDSHEEAMRMWDIIEQYIQVGDRESEGAYQMALKISSWFSHDVKL